MENVLDREQGMVFTSLAELCGMVEAELEILNNSFVTLDDNSRKINSFAREIKARSRDIESECLRVLLRHHPVAKDLRVISAATRISTDLERIGDNASDIAEIIPFVTHSSYFVSLGLVEMGHSVKNMVSSSVDAFISCDIDKAKKIIQSDDLIDAAFDSAKSNISILIKNGDKYADQAPDLLMIAKYFERMGDHAVSLARYVGWSVDGNDAWLDTN